MNKMNINKLFSRLFIHMCFT